MGLIWYFFLTSYLVLNLILSIIVYKKSKIFYEPKIIKETNDGFTPQIINIHQKYFEFSKTDKLSFLRIFIGMNLFFWIKFVLLIINCIALIIFLKISSCFRKNVQPNSQENRRFTERTLKFFVGLEVIILGVWLKTERIKCEELYREYFGNDYKFTYDEGYSCIISNHTGWVDIACHLGKYACGFIAKADVANIPLVGVVAKQIGCLFVKREDANNRQITLDQIHQRQSDFLNGKNFDPLLIFPEGTVTSGKYIMKLKKGAFNSLLPIKPLTINTISNDNFHLSVGSAGLFAHFIRTLCYLYHNVKVVELPVLIPNEYMFQNYSKKNPEITDKWEIYSEVAREIMCRACNFKKTEKTFRDSCEYANTVSGIRKKISLVREEETKSEDKSM